MGPRRVTLTWSCVRHGFGLGVRRLIERDGFAHLLGIVARLDENHVGSCPFVNTNRSSGKTKSRSHQYCLAMKPQLQFH